MNERIQELKDKIWAEEYWIKPNTDRLLPAQLNRFAELIVAECAEIGDNYQEILRNEPECYNCRKVAYGIVDKIKQHFGVEE